MGTFLDHNRRVKTSTLESFLTLDFSFSLSYSQILTAELGVDVKIICYLIMVLVLAGCNSGENNLDNWRKQVAEIDKEIDTLSRSKTSLDHQANEEQRQSLNYMRDDWVRYSQSIEGVEKDSKKESEIDTRIDQLKAKRASLLNQHQREP
jgi:outer membrane murein-binding lipoprotein Lpp